MRIVAGLVALMVTLACGAQSATPAAPSASLGTARPPDAPASPPARSASPVSSPTSPTTVPASASAYEVPARTAAAMTYDSANGRVLMFGGSGDRGPLDDLVAWDGQNWELLSTDGPTARDGALLVYDRHRDVAVLYGGRAGAKVLDDTWEWDGASWRRVDSGGLSARIHAVGGYDITNQRVIVYGGAGSGDLTYTDTWAWDGVAWRTLETTGIPDRAPNGIAWDAAGNQLLTLAIDLSASAPNGLYASDLWRLQTDTWMPLNDQGPSFSPVQSFTSGPEHPFLVDGGAIQREVNVWSWTGTDWKSVAKGGPSPRNGQTVTYDEKRQRLVMFGGFLDASTFADTWEFDGKSWTEAP